MRVEGSSRLARICCQTSARLVPAPPVAAGLALEVELLLAAGFAASLAITAGFAAALAFATTPGFCSARAIATAGAVLAPGEIVAFGGFVGCTACTGSARSPSSNTSSHSRGWALWRNCPSLPRNCCCQRSNFSRPSPWARGGRASRLAGEKPVSSNWLGATRARQRSRSNPANPCSTEEGSRPRSSSSRQPCSRAKGSAATSDWANCSNSCSGTAPSNSHTASGSTGGGSRLS